MCHYGFSKKKKLEVQKCTQAVVGPPLRVLLIFNLPPQLNIWGVITFEQVSAEPRVYLGIPFTCVTVIFYCILVTPHPPPPFAPWWGLRGRKFLILTTLDCWKRHFREQYYIENYFYLLKSTRTTKTTSQKCWSTIIWADFFGRTYRSNGIKTRLGSPVRVISLLKFSG